jgi:hypothetical protein
MDYEHLQAEVQRLAGLAGYYELQWRRASDGAVGANKAVRRLKARLWRMSDALTLCRAESERLRRELDEQTKKVSRLSLKILSMWGGE